MTTNQQTIPVNAPPCRDCAGDGEYFTGARYRPCERCAGVGVEACGECHVGSPRALVVTTYLDTAADGSLYESQVCEACARHLCGLIDPPSPCHRCGWTDAGAVTGPVGWGYLSAQSGASCKHATGERECPSCSETWYLVGQDDSTHDYSYEGEETGYVGGPAKETCPACLAADAEEARAVLVPLLSAVPEETWSVLAHAVVSQLSRVRAPANDAGVYRVIARLEAPTVVEGRA